MRSVIVVSLLVVVAAGAALTGCSGPRLLNSITPNPDRSTDIVRNVAYGPSPHQRLDLYVPDTPGPHPVLVFFHGGSWNSGSKAGYAFVGKRFASMGYLTAVPNYRLSPEGQYPAFMEDAAAAVATVMETARQHNGDPDRVFLTGHSAGGYIAVQLAVADEFLAAHELGQGVIDGVAGIAGPYDFLPSENPDVHDAFGLDADEAVTMPVFRVSATAPPMLLLVGGVDEAVGAHNAENLAAALRDAGTPVTVKTYPTADHDDTIISVALYKNRSIVPVPGSRYPVAEDIAAFFDDLPAEGLGTAIGE